MSPLTLDTVLNLIWVAVGVASLVLLGFLERRRFPVSTRSARWKRLAAVLIVTVALFPSVSSSDDLFSFALINSQLGGHGGPGGTVPEDSKDKASQQLARLLETLTHYQITAVYMLLLALCCVAIVLTVRREVQTRAVLCPSGRSPPLA